MFNHSASFSTSPLAKEAALLPSSDRAALRSWLTAYLIRLLGIREEEINPQEPLASYGLTSRDAVALSGDLAEQFKCVLPPTLVWNHPTIEAIIGYLNEDRSAPEAFADTHPSSEHTTTVPIAIVGMACRFPGARNLEEFWNGLYAGRSAIREAPIERWNVENLYDPLRATPGKMSTRWGGFLDNVDQFDAAFFGISPREATHIDPQQRLLLELTWEALEHAAISPEHLAGSGTGVFVGISTSDYARMQLASYDDIDAYTATGHASSIAANRLSYTLDLHGPSIAVDTACSSSLVAVHLACQSLACQESPLAIVGGVNLLLAPELTIAFSQTRMMASDGHCKPFDAAADGYVRSEGCAVIILKPLPAAQRDGDRILALIRGSAVNQDGRSNGLTAPNGLAQQAAIRQALARAKVQPAQIQYVETHGTGTALGDPIEIQALTNVLQDGREPGNTCAFGAVKSNLGHLEACAGLAGLIKTVLALQHQVIPPTLHLQQFNPHIQLEQTRFIIPTTLYPWPTSTTSRFAGVSSFGFGGTNAHVILEEAPLTVTHQEDCLVRPIHILTLSARSEQALKALAERYGYALAHYAEDALGDICYTANIGRAHLSQRLAVVTSSLEGLQEQLSAFLAQKPGQGYYQGQAQIHKQPQIAFLFTGQGAQYPAMARQLYETQPLFREIINYCDRILRSELDRPLLSILYAEDEADSQIHETQYTQPALFAVEYALAMLWRSWGIEPTLVCGHSVGEYVAACVAGVFALDDGLRLIARRAALMQALPPLGTMAAVRTDEETLRTTLARHTCGQDVSIAAHNGPTSFVIAGEREAIAEICRDLEEQGIAQQILEVSHAFHSALMEPMLAQFSTVASAIPYQPPRIPLISNLDGKLFSPDQGPDADYWCRHAREMVQFFACLQTMIATDCRLFLEIGPHPTLLGMGKRAIKEDRTLWLPSLQQGTADWEVLLSSLAKLYIEGLPIDWSRFERGYHHNKCELPTYPFEHRRYWLKASSIKEAIHEVHHGTTMQSEPDEPITIKNKLPNGTENQAYLRQQSVLEQLQAIVGHPLGMSAREVNIDAFFLEMGADSLILVEIVRVIEKQFAVKLNVRQMFEQLTTLRKLADFIVSQTQEQAMAFAGKEEISVTAATNGQNGTHYSSPSLATKPEHELRPPLPASTGTAFIPYQPLQPRSDTGLTKQQQHHLHMLIERYNARTQRSKQVTQQHRAVLADNRASAGFRFSIKEMLYPIIGSSSQGAYCYDIDGNKYIDLTMGFGVNLFGHNPPFVIEALTEQLQQGIQIGPQSSLAGEVARLICALTGMERVSFVNSGTEAVMTALRLARTATGRAKVALFAGSYHGHFDGVLAVQHQDWQKDHAVPMAPGISPSMVKDVLVLEYGSPQALEQIRLHAQELAAVLVEPVQSRHPDLQPKAFLQQLRTITREIGTALIFDEMITGFRIHPGGSQKWFGIAADLATYGKIVGGGMPIGVVAGKAFYMDSIDGGMWQYGDLSYPQAETTFFAGTFCKHPLAMAAAHANLHYMQEHGEELILQLNQRTTSLANTLNTYFTAQQVPMRVVHFGSLFRFAFSGNMDIFFYHLLEKGIYIWEGRNCFLSTAHTDEDILQIIIAVQESITEMRAGGFLPAPQPDTSGACPSPEEVPAPAFYQQKTAQGATVYPLTEAQRQLWILAQLDPEGFLAYNETMLIELRGMLKPNHLLTAIRAVVERHEALRTLVTKDGEHQRVMQQPCLKILAQDFSLVAAPRQEEELQRCLQELCMQPFDLQQEPAIRFALLKQRDDQYMLALIVHHMLVDGWSLGTILQEIAAYYASACKNTVSQPAPALQFREYVSWQSAQMASKEMREHEAYWMQRFAVPPPLLELPLDKARPALRSYRGTRLSMALEADLLTAIKQLAKARHTTLFATLFAMYALLLHRLTGQDDLVVGVPVAGRALEGGDHLVGYCVNVLPVRVSIQQAVSFEQHLATVTRLLLEAFEHEAYPFATLLNTLQLPRDSSHAPLVNTILNLDRSIDTRQFSGLEARVVSSPFAQAKFEFSLNMQVQEDSLQLDADYNTDLFTQETVARWLKHFRTLIESIVSQPDASIADLNLLTAQERQQLLRVGNAPPLYSISTESIDELFERQVVQSPDAIALVCGESVLTYGELSQLARQVAELLYRQGVAPHGLVGMCLGRSIEFVACLLGVLKARCTYIPLDPTYPRERLALMLSGAHLKAVITHRRLHAQLPSSEAPIIYIDEHWQQLRQSGDSDVASALQGNELLYMLYTSGSTGQPKGAGVYQASFVNLLRWFIEEFAIAKHDRVLLISSLSFDLTQKNIFAPLLVGGTLVCPADEQYDVTLLRQTLYEQGITLLNCTPSAFYPLLEQDDSNLCEQTASLRYVFLGGEPIAFQRLETWLHSSRAEVVNTYGPTECTDVVAFFRLPKQEPEATIPIGGPIWSTQLLVLDRFLQLQPIGVRGELYISGDCVGIGYLNDNALTAERFLPDPFSTVAGRRLYKTGDVVRYRPDGNLEFCGRVDHQVKLRGYRIELGEIEALLDQHPAIGKSAVIIREDTPGDQRLVAYVVPAREYTLEQARQELSRSHMHNYLREKLAQYMLPSHCIILEELPLTPGGKLDRQALPPLPARDSLSEETLESARNTLEEALVTIYAEVLQLRRVGIHEDFFILGGHSLLATQVISRIRAMLHIELPLRSLFAAPTVAELAEYIKCNSASGKAFNLPPLLPAAPGVEFPLSFAQQRLWVLYQFRPEDTSYLMSLPFRLKGELRPDILQHCLAEIIARHNLLRTNFILSRGEPRQIVRATSSFTLPLIDFQVLNKKQQDAELERLISEDSQCPFDLSRQSLVRMRVFRFNTREHVLLLTTHHIVFDGWSQTILLNELVQLYEAFCQQQPSPLAALPVQYADFAVWQRSWLQGETLNAFTQYWIEQLRGSTPLRLPTDYPRPDVPVHGGAGIFFTWPAQLAQSLKSLSQQEGVTLFMTLLVAFQTLLYRFTGQEDIIVGADIANRTQAELEGLIGFFINILVLRNTFHGNPRFRDILKQARETILGAYAHQDMPFEKLVDILQPDRSFNQPPLINVLFVFQNVPQHSFQVQGLAIEPFEGSVETAKFDFAFFMWEEADRLAGGVNYNADLFKASTIQRLIRQFECLAHCITTERDIVVDAIELETKEEKEHRLQKEMQAREGYRHRLKVAKRREVALPEVG